LKTIFFLNSNNILLLLSDNNIKIYKDPLNQRELIRKESIEKMKNLAAEAGNKYSKKIKEAMSINRKGD